MKAILVMDMPACCGECEMSGTGVCRKWNMEDIHTFPENCPLKKISQEMIEEYQEARDKQIAQSPIVTDYHYICPKCMTSRNINQKYAFCPSCGQRLAWGQET